MSVFFLRFGLVIKLGRLYGVCDENGRKTSQVFKGLDW